jgi:hypothetical protein
MAIPYGLRTGPRHAYPHDTRAVRRNRTPGSRNTENHSQVDGLDMLVDPRHFETLPDGGRTSLMPVGTNVDPYGGWVRYREIQGGQRYGVEAVITPHMLGTGTTPSYVFPFTTRRTGLMIVRGHLLARVLGGDGSEPRNLVPLYHIRSNLPMYEDVEGPVQHYLARGGSVRVSIRPRYRVRPFGVPRSEMVFPIALEYRAVDAASGANVLPKEVMRLPTGFRPGS